MKTQKRSSEAKKSTGKKLQAEARTIGIGIGDQWSHYCVLDHEGEVIEEGRMRTHAEAFAKHFAGEGRVRIPLKNGTHSIWINEQLLGYGHDVIVANVRELHAICRNDRKSDRVEAEKLARFTRLDPNILRPIQHRSMQQQEVLTVIRARNILVRTRAALVNATCGLAKPCGFRLPACATSTFLSAAWNCSPKACSLH